MPETASKNGSCLCGAVTFAVSNFSKKVGACHCSMCRRWGGGPVMAVDCGTDISFKGEENITVYDSSDWAERGFCNKCGSHLFYRLKESNQHYVPVGLFDDQAPFVFDSQVFIDKKPSFYSFANQTNDMTEAEVFEMYALP
ncbi:MAG: GFA family protein [Leptolyngbya sp. SIO1E4]|nr:GFA family protein [Leptolyngbya sp. SIO1E4]